ncbi:MAG: hypothetical protein FWH06_04655 [Oscillospiraceae bacterium]|nr:hypothetical protein [Oscillospiraceae bacterium]
MPKREKGQDFKSDMRNPAGPIDKTGVTKNIPGIRDDTRVVFSEERNGKD